MDWIFLKMKWSCSKSRRSFSRYASLLFPVLFTLGFIFGSFYSSTLNEIVCAKPNIQTADSLQQNRAFVVVIILSSPENVERRHVIRNTWLLTKGNNSIKHYFAMSVKSISPKILIQLKDEHRTHQDLLFLYSFADSFSMLSEKIKETLSWVDKNCNYRFLLKVDDDSFVRLSALLQTLRKLPQEKLYWGFFDGQASIKTRGKWKEKNWFLCDRYLPYAKGGGYVLSQDLVHLIASLSNYLVSYQNEDVSIGTWLAPFEVNRIHEPNFDTEFHSRGCFNSYLITHKQTPSMMMQKYQKLIDSGYLCQLEQRMRNSYIYNWKVLPSQCCQRTDSVP